MFQYSIGLLGRERSINFYAAQWDICVPRQHQGITFDYFYYSSRDGQGFIYVRGHTGRRRIADSIFFNGWNIKEQYELHGNPDFFLANESASFDPTKFSIVSKGLKEKIRGGILLVCKQRKYFRRNSISTSLL